MNLTEELNKCAKCGTCRSVCPVFKETGAETLVTRGRLALFYSARKGELAVSGKLREVLDTCLLCRKCRAECPSLVVTDELIVSAREWVNRRGGLPLSLKIVFRFIIPYRRIYNLLLRIYSYFSGRGGKEFIRHLPLALAEPFQRLPPLNRNPVLVRPGKTYQAPNMPRVAIFTGCLVNYVYPEIYDATTRLLDRAGVSYTTPREQLCCGMPLLLYGDRTNARRIARHNFKVFAREKTDAVITLCASCNRMLREEYPKLRMTKDEGRIPVLDIMEFLPTVRSYKLQVTSKNTNRVAYHQPCHSAQTPVGVITRMMLRQITDYREMPEEELCCGGGGAFAFRHPELSRQIGQHKIDAWEKEMVDTVVTGCPGCRMQLTYLLREAGQEHIKICHPVELLSANS